MLAITGPDDHTVRFRAAIIIGRHCAGISSRVTVVGVIIIIVVVVAPSRLKTVVVRKHASGASPGNAIVFAVGGTFKPH